MSASTHWLATASAQAVLERGGNAFDAAVAGGFVLHVVEPHLNGPGGDLVGIFATADDPGTPVVLMGQGPAPAGATIEHFRAEGLDLVPGAGGLAAAVPGAVDAWLALLCATTARGSSPTSSPTRSATRATGTRCSRRPSATIARVADLFTDHWPSSAALWMPEGQRTRAGHDRAQSRLRRRAGVADRTPDTASATTGPSAARRASTRPAGSGRPDAWRRRRPRSSRRRIATPTAAITPG